MFVSLVDATPSADPFQPLRRRLFYVASPLNVCKVVLFVGVVFSSSNFERNNFLALF